MSLQRRILARALRALEAGPAPSVGALDALAQEVALASGLSVFPVLGFAGTFGLLIYRDTEYLGTVAAYQRQLRGLGAEGVEAVCEAILAPESSGHIG